MSAKQFDGPLIVVSNYEAKPLRQPALVADEISNCVVADIKRYILNQAVCNLPPTHASAEPILSLSAMHYSDLSGNCPLAARHRLIEVDGCGQDVRPMVVDRAQGINPPAFARPVGADLRITGRQHQAADLGYAVHPGYVEAETRVIGGRGVGCNRKTGDGIKVFVDRNVRSHAKILLRIDRRALCRDAAERGESLESAEYEAGIEPLP